ncbi:MAG: hypothetical protein ACK4WH_05295 [Phycisphaerales bacterium]
MHGWMSVVWAAASCAAMVSPAAAQTGVKDVEPYIAVVSTDKVPMRGGDAAFMYPVRELKAGEMVRVNGEGPGWVRVDYLPGTRAYVAASDAELAKDGKALKLVRQSQLMAWDASPSPKAPWWPLDMAKPLDAGTTLEVISVQKASDNVVQGYVVPAPQGARGFIARDHVRKASAEEAARFVGANGSATTATPPVQPAGETSPTDKPAPRPEQTHATNDTASAPPGFAPVTPPTAPAGETAAAPMPTPVVVPPAPAAPKLDEDLVQLRTMFDKTMASKDNEELPVVIGMFENKIAKLGSTPGEQGMKTQLLQRLQALKLRQEIIVAAERAREVSQQSVSRVTEITVMVDRVQKQAIYNVVGRIVPSTVYDGRRGLPLMYRVQSADALAPRTVGYIVPQEGIDLISKLGKVCGVVGESRFDDSLGLNIIAPRRIDVLGVSATTTNQPGNPDPAPAQASPEATPPATVVVPTETVPVSTTPEK